MINFIIAHWPFFTALGAFLFGVLVFCQSDPLVKCQFLQWFQAIWLMASLVIVITYWLPSWLIIAVSIYGYGYLFLRWANKPKEV